MLELQRNLYVLRRWWWLLIGAAIVGGVVAYGLTKILVKPSYVATAIVSIAPNPTGDHGPYFGLFSVGADAQLVRTLSTAQAAHRPAGVRAQALADSVAGSPSVDGELLSLSVKWSNPQIASELANAVAAVFMQQERQRLEARYAVIHNNLVQQQRHLADLMTLETGNGPAHDWLQSTYAATATRLYQDDTSARIQATTQEASLQLAQPASASEAVVTMPRASYNGALGAILALLVAAVFAFVATSSYGQVEATEGVRPVLSKVGE